MSPTDHPALLSTQLMAVLDEVAAGHGDLREQLVPKKVEALAML